MTRIFKTMFVATSLAASSVAMAQSPAPAPFIQGVRSGKLTPAETNALAADMNALKAVKSAAMRDGFISRKERQRITQMESRFGQKLKTMVGNKRSSLPLKPLAPPRR